MQGKGLVTAQVDVQSILDEYQHVPEDTNVKITKNMPVLGFVTPWNGRMYFVYIFTSDGYDIARKFHNKFTHISPCWFQFRR